MKRISTIEDLPRMETHNLQQKRTKAVCQDPLEDLGLPFSEKHRLSSLWEIIQSNRQNQAKLNELLGPFLKSNPQTPEKASFPLSSGLQMACLYGDLNLVKMLVSRGENVDQVTMSPDNFGRGRCAMSVAAELGHNKILEFLILAGGDVKNMHDPPLKHAVRRNDLEAVRMLVRGGADPNPTLHQLLWPSCDINVVRMLLQAGASPSGTMLLTALWRGCDARVIEVLLDFGAPFRSDLENESAVEVAICRGADRKIVEVLLKASPNWSTATHKMYPRTFRDRVSTLFKINNRAGVFRLPQTVMHRIIEWTCVAEKRDGDRFDIQRSLCNSLDLSSLENRMVICGFEVESHAYFQSESISKASLLKDLSTEDLCTLLWHEDLVAQNYEATLPRGNNSSEATLDAAGGRDDERGEARDNQFDILTHNPKKQQSRKRKPSAPAVYVNDGGKTLAGLGYGASNNRRLAHPVADSRNPNSPKPHHCTCCHVCHVSMKQRPRPIAACSQCNTIICKLCLQDRWKNDQWEEACSTSGWVCHKCLGTCVCKACKSKGSRLNGGVSIENAPLMIKK